MSQIIAALTAGAGVQSQFVDTKCDSYLLVGDVDTAMPLQGLQVEIEGQGTVINIPNSQPLVSAFSKFMSQFCSTLVGMVLKIASGEILKKTTYRFTNNGLTTPPVFSYSEGGNGKPVRVGTETINALSNQLYTDFTALFLTPSANLGNLDIVFSDGTLKTLTVVEADALFSMKNQTEANGRLDAVVTVIDNRDGSIKSVRVNATTAITVMKMNFSASDFAQLKNA